MEDTSRRTADSLLNHLNLWLLSKAGLMPLIMAKNMCFPRSTVSVAPFFFKKKNLFLLSCDLIIQKDLVCGWDRKMSKWCQVGELFAPTSGLLHKLQTACIYLHGIAAASSWGWIWALTEYQMTKVKQQTLGMFPLCLPLYYKTWWEVKGTSK